MINQNIINDFPLLHRKLNGKPIIYLDSTATSLKPKSVIRAINGYYGSYTSNVFRGIYKISEKATKLYEEARGLTAKFIGAQKPEEIVFTRNTTESINLVYYSWALNNIHSGDEVVVSIMEHHSNFVPWQELAKKTGCVIKIWNIDKDGQLNYSDLNHLITRKTKLFTFTSASNVTGIIVDVAKAIKIAKTINTECLVLVDAAQSVPHMPVHVTDWNADFVAFSGHKMLAPTGIGVLWAKYHILCGMSPYQFGGDMINEVHDTSAVYKDPPHKFEAGTPHIAGVIGLGAAIRYLNDVGMQNIRDHEKDITAYALEKMLSISDLNIIGPKKADSRGGVIAFTMKGVHPHDIAQILDEDNICIRVGYHCAQPLHEYIGCGPTARASFYLYTSKSDIDKLIDGIVKVKNIFK